MPVLCVSCCMFGHPTKGGRGPIVIMHGEQVFSVHWQHGVRALLYVIVLTEAARHVLLPITCGSKCTLCGSSTCCSIVEQPARPSCMTFWGQ